MFGMLAEMGQDPERPCVRRAGQRQHAGEHRRRTPPQGISATRPAWN
jgi:hypothetical protein